MFGLKDVLKPDVWGKMHLENYKRDGRNPVAWLRSAIILQDAAKVIDSSPGLGRSPPSINLAFSTYALMKAVDQEAEANRARLRVYLMLMGFAVENLLKGLTVRHHPDLVTDELKGPLARHNFENLIDTAKVRHLINEELKPVVRLLETHVMGAGRYHIRKRANEKWAYLVDSSPTKAGELYSVLLDHVCDVFPDHKKFGIHRPEIASR